MKKRFISLVLVALLLLSLIPTASAACNHSPAWSTRTYPTCTTAGKKEFKCTKCGTVLTTSTIPALGGSHTWGTRSYNSTRGNDIQKCTKCSAVRYLAHSHSYSNSMYAWSYNKSTGKDERKCQISGCNYVDKRNHVHRWTITSYGKLDAVSRIAFWFTSNADRAAGKDYYVWSQCEGCEQKVVDFFVTLPSGVKKGNPRP